MSFYQKLSAIGAQYLGKATMLKHGFNLSPMYRRTTARILTVSDDLLQVRVKLPLSWKNSNYVGSIFGGSMCAAVDPIFMIQLINVLGDEYVVWDKSATVNFRRPARETLYINFRFTPEELADIKNRVANEKEIDIVKSTSLTNKAGDIIFCEVQKTIYVADKVFYKAKRARRAAEKAAEAAAKPTVK